MGKKSPVKRWLIQYANLPPLEVSARTEGAAKQKIFKFLLKEEKITHNERHSFLFHSRVGILKQKEENAVET